MLLMISLILFSVYWIFYVKQFEHKIWANYLKINIYHE